MRGELSPKLTDFIATVNVAAKAFKSSGQTLTTEQARLNLQKLSAFVTKVPEISFIADKEIRHETLSVPVRLFSPDTQRPLPVLVYFHGGGHMCGDIELYDPMCRKLAIHSHCHVVAVEYRRSPEHPYPCGLVDAEITIKNIQLVLGDVQHNGQIFIAGDSAGGAICTSILMRQTSYGSILSGVTIDKQILIYPSVDYTGSTGSYIENGTGYLLENNRIKWYFDHYFTANEDRKLASPLFGPLPENYPKTLIITAGCDPLRDEGLAYLERLITKGVETQHVQFEGMIHAFMNIEDLVPDECQSLYSEISRFVQAE
ncbi:alpha/beta hydrolase [Psychrosphaera algicola]|uniref:Alpha/beta hydrolase n=1 Tax=Psychrosphaera algicola TaxID=3023714 RepID=A0ABT5F883_9GAMM|nr:alpha/beta hydrolase [Psychrosphaera sp. G1-22]MDC2887753.1 alpha/beta hydrolase [Psychrosphaera sp. G1-22]